MCIFVPNIYAMVTSYFRALVKQGKKKILQNRYGYETSY